MLELEIPYPPTTNTYYRAVGGRVLISAKGRQYRKKVQAVLWKLKLPKIIDEIELEIFMHPPDKRKRDCDNIQKPILDSLQHGGLFEDDYQVVKLTTERFEKIKGGYILIQIRIRK